MADLSTVNKQIANSSKLILDVAENATKNDQLFNPTHLSTLSKKESLPQAYADWLKGWEKFSKAHPVETGTDGITENAVRWKYKVQLNGKDYTFICHEEEKNAVFETYTTSSGTKIPNSTCLPVSKDAITGAINSMNNKIEKINDSIKDERDTIVSFEQAIRDNLYVKFQESKNKLGADYQKYEALLKKLDSSGEVNNHFEKNLEAELKITLPYTTYFGSGSSEASELLANAFSENTKEDKGKATTSYKELQQFLMDAEGTEIQKQIILKWKRSYDSALQEKHTLEKTPKFKAYLELEKQLPEYQSSYNPAKPKDKAEAEKAIGTLNAAIRSNHEAIGKMRVTLGKLEQLKLQAK